MTTLFAAWWLPRFTLQALRLPQGTALGALEVVPGAEAAARRQEARLICVSEAAERAGVTVGLTVSQALARCPGLRVVYRDAAAEEALQDGLLRCAEAWTPDGESTRPGLCLLDLSLARWRDGLSWLERGMLMRRELAEAHLEARVGLAPRADLAILASQVADPVRVLDLPPHQGEGLQALRELPLSVLTDKADLLRLLGLWGVRTLGQLADLPREAVARRLGAEGLALHDQARGGRERLLRLVRRAARFEEEVELEAGIECLEPLLHVLGAMVQRLCARLAEAWRVAGALRLRLAFDDRSSHERELRVAEPTREAAVLLRLLETALEGLKAAAPITQVALEMTPVRAASCQGSLFDQGLRDPNRFAETLSALEAILGKGRVGRVERLASRRVDAFRVRPFLEGPPVGAVASAETRSFMPMGLPLLRLRGTPARAEAGFRQGRPAWVEREGKRKRLTAVRGPFFLSGEWWDEGLAWEETVWEAEVEGGGLVRLGGLREEAVVVSGEW